MVVLWGGGHCRLDRRKHAISPRCSMGAVSIRQRIIPIYKPSITCRPLRYALLAYAGAMTSRGIFGSREEGNTAATLSNICRKSPTGLEEGDLFASVLLGLTASAKPNPLGGELGVYVDGFLAILKQLVRTDTGYQPLYHLATFWPLARDLLLSCQGDGIKDSQFCLLYIESRMILGHASLEQRSAYIGDRVMRLRVSLHYHDIVMSRSVRMAFANHQEAVAIIIQDIEDDLKSIKDFMKDSQM